MRGSTKKLRAACLALCLAAAAGVPAGASASPLTVSPSAGGRPIPAGFVGLSVEFRGLAAYAGTDPRAVDPAFLQLIRDIAPRQRPVLRIGGDSTDWSWWPVPYLTRPPGIRYDLTPDFMSVARSLAQTLRARLILGINLEANSRRLAAAEATAMVKRIGASAIDALEIGNEAELYKSFGWYRTASGQEIPGRPPSYDLSAFMGDFSRIARVMPRVPLAGPSDGGSWLASLGSFLGQEPSVRVATLHAYPLKHCTPSQVVTTAQLLADSSSHGLAAYLLPYVAIARHHRVATRVDELNAVTCGGQRGVSDTFGSALWSLDALFEMAAVGVDGVNFHTVPGTINEILGPSFTGGHWQVRVHPEYYGLVMFAQAAPPGSQLLQIGGAQMVGVKTWATLAPDRTLRVTLINKHLRRGETVRLRLPAGYGPASLEQLRAPSVQATSQVTLGGQTFGSQTRTGLLAGPSRVSTLRPVRGTYVVHLPPASASLLVLAAG
ncbi:MAG: glycosyl hydrolase family 79 C-terminal domain-containing protein [Candidatus Dormibacteraeota bacterium]|nr:glycosyl hydrolase family 79 C-terminal domain-containing protein [Candidatus Dormibacteraeota bacterium]